MNALRRASAVLFYFFGTLTVLAIVLVNRGIAVAPLSTFLNSIDLPLLLTGMLFGGSSLVTSLGREKVSMTVAFVVFLPLAAAFGFFAWMNFSMPFTIEI